MPQARSSASPSRHFSRSLVLVLTAPLLLGVAALASGGGETGHPTESLRLDDEIFRLDATDRLWTLLQESEAEVDARWFSIRVEAQAMARELSLFTAPAERRWVTPKRLHELRAVLDRLEQRAAGLRTDAAEEGTSDGVEPPGGLGSNKGEVPPPIVGRVTDELSGDGIPGITVHAAFPSGTIAQSAVTDALGDYFLENFAVIPDASYYVFTGSTALVSAPFIDEVWDDAPCFGGLCDLSVGGQLIPLLPGQASPEIDLALSKGGQISGSLVDGNTLEPLPSAFLRFFDDEGTQLDFDLSPTDGSYETPALPPGQYYVRAFGPVGYVSVVYPDILCPGFACDVTEGQLIEVTAEGNTDASFELVLSASISGTITDEVTGDPLDNLLVRVYDATGNLVQNDRTESDGTYQVMRLLGGRHYAQVWAGTDYFSELWDDLPFDPFNPQLGTPIDLVMSEDTPGIDFQLQPGARMSGTVTVAADGSPIPWRTISVWDGTGSRSTVTDGEGHFEYGPLAQGTAYAWTDLRIPGLLDEAWDDDACTGEMPPDCGTPIPVVGLDLITGIDIALDPASSIRGRVTASDTGLPIAGVEVRIAAGSFATTGSDGTYELTNVAEGSYLLRVTHPDYVAQASGGVPCLPFDCPDDLGEPILVPYATVVEGVDFALDPGSFISGSISSVGTGQPIPNVVVWIYDETGLPVTAAFTDSSGNYRTTAAPLDGNYYLNTPIVATGYMRELWQNHRGLFHGPSGPVAGVLFGDPIEVLAATEAIRNLDLDFLATAPELQVTLDFEPGAGGHVGSVNDWIDCGSLCTNAFPTGAEVALSATPDAGSLFLGWSGDADCDDGVVTMNGDVACTAAFALPAEPPFFADGFESGDLSGWSDSVP